MVDYLLVFPILELYQTRGNLSFKKEITLWALGTFTRVKAVRGFTKQKLDSLQELNNEDDIEINVIRVPYNPRKKLLTHWFILINFLLERNSLTFIILINLLLERNLLIYQSSVGKKLIDFYYFNQSFVRKKIAGLFN